MKIAFVGDIHCHYELLQDLPVDLILQVGDFGIYPRPDHIDPKTKAKSDASAFLPYWSGEKQFKTPILFVRGNHEDNEFLLATNYLNGPLLPNLTLIPDGSIIIYENLVILGMGGIHAPKTWDLPVLERKGKRFNHFSKFDFEEAYKSIDAWETVPRENYVKLFIGHEAPTHEPPPGTKLYSHFGGCKPIADLVKRWEPAYARFGHYHYAKDIDLGPKINSKIMQIKSIEIIEI